MKCKNCGQENREGEEFCTECGFHINFKSYEFDKFVPYKNHWYRSEYIHLKILALGSVLMLALIYFTMIEPF